MKCSNCGKEIADDSRFCEFCGSQIKIKEDKKLKWGQLLIGAIFLIIGVLILQNVNRKDSQDHNAVSLGGTVYYGTYIGDQYVYEGMIDAIQKNYNWNSTSYKPEKANYEVTNVYYNGDYLLQLVPNVDSRGVSSVLSIYVKIQPSLKNKFKRIKSFTNFTEDPGWADIYYTDCYNDVSLAAKTASDVIQNVFDVPHGAILTYSDK